MNVVNPGDIINKNCLLVFRSKRINEFDGANSIISAFAGFGYYFDKISYIAYDNSKEIIRAIKEGKEYYGNLVIYCPAQMEKTLKEYIAGLYSSEFDGLGILKRDDRSVFLLMSDCENRLTNEDIKNVLDEKCGINFDRTYLKTIGAPPALIQEAMMKAKSVCTDINFNVSEKFGDSRIEIVYTRITPKMVLDNAIRTVLSVLNEYVYAMEDISIAQRLSELLRIRRMKISVAESFTGGGVGGSLVNIPGASEIFYEGLNTYSNEAKKQRLGVKDITLMQYGAVSDKTAYEMAEGLIRSGNCDVSIATTGIAGPKSDNTKKPVGLIYIAVGTADSVSVYNYNLKGDRNCITNTAIRLALFHAYKKLK